MLNILKLKLVQISVVIINIQNIPIFSFATFHNDQFGRHRRSLKKLVKLNLSTPVRFLYQVPLVTFGIPITVSLLKKPILDLFAPSST